MENSRAERLKRHFDGVLAGRVPPTAPISNAIRFLEAICAQPDAVVCVDRIIGSKAGVDAVQAAMRVDCGLAFLNGIGTTFLTYLQAPELKTLSSGTYLRQIVLKIVDPPVFWSAHLRSFQEGLLQPHAQQAFAWLLVQLLLLPADHRAPYEENASDSRTLGRLLASPHRDVKALGERIQQILDSFKVAVVSDTEDGPGGRHDNDFEDFRKIAIRPTADEISSQQPPFLRPSAALDALDAGPLSLTAFRDNQFRLLREDMIHEMREEILIALGKKKGKHRGTIMDGVKMVGAYFGTEKRDSKWGIAFSCKDDLWQLKKVKDESKRRAVLDDNKSKILRHGSLACLLADNEIVAFPTIHRDEDYLARKPPVIVLQFEGEASITHALCKIKSAERLKVIQIDTALFAFDPVLKALQDTTEMPISEELFFWGSESDIRSPPSPPQEIIDAIRANPAIDLSVLLGTPKKISLDSSQSDSLLAALTQRVSLIQGPPGTGKSFIGAVATKILHDETDLKILVVCYTNHALDQFLEDLLDIGIPPDSMVRLGGKSTTRTEALSLYNQGGAFRPTRAHYAIRDGLRVEADRFKDHLDKAFSAYSTATIRQDTLLTFLEFEVPVFFEAFLVPMGGEMTHVGKRGKAADELYLIDRWMRGHDAGFLSNAAHVRDAAEIWGMNVQARQSQIAGWRDEIFKERVLGVYTASSRYDRTQDQLARHGTERQAETLRSKRIVACTTTAAAKYAEIIQTSAQPGVLLVEEAGEILESHIITALGPETKQLILIGDHKQLRPKVNHYALTVEKGDGYDLNRSLFERLVLKGYPHVTLTTQHRMRTEIAKLVRDLTYPELVDAPTTRGRPDLRGVQDNIIFIDHTFPEDERAELADRRDMGAKSSKQNSHEVAMILKILRYLGQQGYGTDDIVILTPYLGQLHMLVGELRKTNDPILNDLDSAELVRAGLLSPATANMAKKAIRVATIDNYQGEESDIVLASLTRSNSQGDIGFMSAPERLNVLISRARNALIMIGNSETFLHARKGSELWARFLGMLKSDKYIHEGLPVKCERHPSTTAVLGLPADFDIECPDGGCKEPCGTKLACGVHDCPSRCHAITDHSKMDCKHIMYALCANGHSQSWMCAKPQPSVCQTCTQAAADAEEARRKAFLKQEKEAAAQRAHDKRMSDLEEQVTKERQKLRELRLAAERDAAFAQKQHDLQDARDAAADASRPPAVVSSAPVHSGPATSTNSPVAPMQNATPAPDAPGPTPPGTSPRSNDASRPTAPIPVQPNGRTAPANAARVASSAAVAAGTHSPPMIRVKSEAEEDWKRQKSIDGATNEHIDAIMDMTGLEAVKAQILGVKAKIDINIRRRTSLQNERFNVALLGNPGTGKTTIARHYAKFLASVDVLPGVAFVETTGSKLANEGVSGARKHVEGTLKAGGGAIFVDEAYQLTNGNNSQGRPVLDYLLAEMENNVGKLIFIFAGYTREMESFFEHNPGLPDRVPHRFKFEDYTDSEFLEMLGRSFLRKPFDGKFTFEEGVRGLYTRIAIRRLGRGRGRNGFGNARALENIVAAITTRQADRIKRERRAGQRPSDFFLSREDIIGLDPAAALVKSDAWQKLHGLTGLQSVKQSVQNMFDTINVNYQRELVEKEPIQVSLNRVFLGSPGTGKTTVARYYGQILADLGLLSRGEVVVKNPSDFIADVIGGSEKQTRAILASTIGKVLVIDEAYMLYGGEGSKGGNTDVFKTAVIDTIVAEVQSVPGDDRCVLLLGYKEQMEEMFQNVNPGLSRRFAIEDAFTFDDFSDAELMEILEQKLRTQNLETNDAAKAVALEVLGRSRRRPHFGNGGAVENILAKAKLACVARRARLPPAERRGDIFLEAQDFDVDFDRGANAADDIPKLFEDLVGCDQIMLRMQEFANIAQVMRARDPDADPLEFIPTSFIFKGPPGTGKTTVARKIGEIFYSMGFLASPEVNEHSASDLVGQYVGHTGPKTQKLLEKSLGQVLFIDEAYRLGEGHFAKEAVDELVGLLTQPKYMRKIVVILAGYSQDINDLIATNPGLSSRFPVEFVFEALTPFDCFDVLRKALAKKKVRLSLLDDPSGAAYEKLETILEQLALLPSWGNARDVKTVAEDMIRIALLSASGDPSEELVIEDDEAIVCFRDMLQTRREREANVTGASVKLPKPKPPVATQQTKPRAAAPPKSKAAAATPTAPPDGPDAPDSAEKPPGAVAARDAGVSDAVWEQLQRDKAAAEAAQRRSDELVAALDEELRDVSKERDELKEEMTNAAEPQPQTGPQPPQDDEAARRAEATRIARVKRAADLARKQQELERRIAQEKARQEQEEKAQRKLRTMGVCVMGFRWIKQAGGYRCAAGGHFVSDAQLNE